MLPNSNTHTFLGNASRLGVQQTSTSTSNQRAPRKTRPVVGDAWLPSPSPPMRQRVEVYTLHLAQGSTYWSVPLPSVSQILYTFVVLVSYKEDELQRRFRTIRSYALSNPSDPTLDQPFAPAGSLCPVLDGISLTRPQVPRGQLHA